MDLRKGTTRPFSKWRGWGGVGFSPLLETLGRCDFLDLKLNKNFSSQVPNWILQTIRLLQQVVLHSSGLKLGRTHLLELHLDTLTDALLLVQRESCMQIGSFLSYKCCETSTFWASELTWADFFFNHATTCQAYGFNFLMVGWHH